MNEQSTWSIKKLPPTGSPCEVHPSSYCQRCKGSLPILLVITTHLLLRFQGYFVQKIRLPISFAVYGKLTVAAITVDLKWP